MGPTYLVKELKELGAGLVDGADDGAAALGKPFHQGHHLEAGGAVQTTASQRYHGMLRMGGTSPASQVTMEGGPVTGPVATPPKSGSSRPV